MKIILKISLYLLIFYAAWLGMMLVHELGHSLGAWVSGGEVEKVYFHPLDFSRTDLARNPHPLFTAWAGPIVGVLIPLIIYAFFKIVLSPNRGQDACVTKLLGLFAGFCLIVNGLYLAAGSFYHAGDPADILRLGCPRVYLFLFAALTAPAGLFLWHTTQKLWRGHPARYS